MLQADEVTLRYHRRVAVAGVSLSLSVGEVLAVLGANGAGKSTLLAVLAGALLPQQGSVTLDGRALGAWPPAALARRRAVLPQAAEPVFAFRVLEMVLLGRSPHAGHSSREQDLDVAWRCLTETGVAHLAERSYATLSGGERRRVQFARVLAQIGFAGEAYSGAARFLLLDEPTASLDLAHQHVALQSARRATGYGIGVLVILHDLNLAARYADRILVLHRGHVAAVGTPAEVLTETLIRDAFALPVQVGHHPSRDCLQVTVV